MSSERRRQELRAEQEDRDLAREREEARYAALTMYEKIEECITIHDIKVLLHEIAEKIEALEP